MPAPAAALSRRALDTALLRAGRGRRRRDRARRRRRARSRTARCGSTMAGRSRATASSSPPASMSCAARRGPRPGANAAIGLRWRLAASPALTRLLAGRIELHLFRGGYAGLDLQEDGGANLCLAVRPARFAAAGRPPGHAARRSLRAEAPALADRDRRRRDGRPGAGDRQRPLWLARDDGDARPLPHRRPVRRHPVARRRGHGDRDRQRRAPPPRRSCAASPRRSSSPASRAACAARSRLPPRCGTPPNIPPARAR